MQTIILKFLSFHCILNTGFNIYHCIQNGAFYYHIQQLFTVLYRIVAETKLWDKKTKQGFK